MGRCPFCHQASLTGCFTSSHLRDGERFKLRGSDTIYEYGGDGVYREVDAVGGNHLFETITCINSVWM